MRYFQLFLMFIFSFQLANAEELLFGHLQDIEGEELPFVNIYIENTTIGTTSNANGDYQLKCESTVLGKNLVFQFVGYKTQKRIITAEDFQLPIQVVLKEENYQLNEMVLTDGEYPALRIIRQVIENKEDFNKGLANYSNRAYIKSVMKLDSIPEKLPFFLPQDEPIDSSELGILYLSEALSDYYWQAPDDYKEKMIASKVSGQSNGISFNRVSDMDINFYDDYIEIGGISQRPFISPVANQAFTYYKYKLEGSFYEEGKMIYKVRVSPKRSKDPCFSGYIFIVDGDWVIHSVDLNLNKSVPMEFADHIHFDQQYIHQDNHWLLFSNNMQITLSLFGFAINYDVVNFYSNYVLNTKYTEDFFGNEVFTADEDVNEKDSAFWNQIRPQALTKIEEEDYIEKDSLELYYKSDAYLDSLDQANAKVSVMGVLYGGITLKKRKKYRTIEIDGLLKNLSFNPVEGMRLESRISYEKKHDFDISRKAFKSDLKIAYGFSDKKVKGKLNLNFRPDRIKPLRYGVSLYSDLFTLNDREPIQTDLSSYFTLFEKEHYRKLYKAEGISLAYKNVPLNGLYLSGKLNVSRRTPVENNTNYSWKYKSKEYENNNPEEWERNSLASLDVRFVYRHNQKYETNPRYGKRILSNPNPDLYARFKQGIGLSTETDNYTLLQLGISEEMNLRLLGTTAWDIKGSKFLDKGNLLYLDKVHFMGNETPFLGRDEGSTYTGSLLQSFHLLSFHNRSTENAFVEGHISHHFNGFILNKVPLIRSLKWQLVAGLNTLVEEDKRAYQEAYLGIENIFKILRVDWAVELGENAKINHGILFGIKFNVL